jgi:hypothetical protein
LHRSTSKVNHTYRFREVPSQFVQQIIQSNLRAQHVLEYTVQKFRVYV